MTTWFQKVVKNPELRLILMLAALFTFIRVFSGFSKYYEYQMMGYDEAPWLYFQNRLLAWGIHMLFLVIIVKTTRRFLMDDESWGKIIAIHFVLAVVIAFLWYSTYALLSQLFWYSEEQPSPSGGFWLWFIQNFEGLFRNYLFTASLIYTYYYIRRDSINRMQKSKIENQLLQARMSLLKSQLHPHFLFNTLNSIASLMETDIKKSRDMLADLSDLLRHVLDFKDLQLVPLKEEIGLLQKYIDIEKTRFSEQLQVSLQVAPNLDLVLIPNMILQPIVENSIQHGFSPNHPELTVQIEINKRKDRLFIEVKDNGKGLKNGSRNKVSTKGMGLKNTLERLQSIYGDDFIFEIKNLSKGVVNQIEIPIKFAEAKLIQS